MKSHTIYVVIIVALVTVIGWGSSVLDAKREALEAELTHAEGEVTRWQATAASLKESVNSQQELARQCLQREVDALADAATRDSIMQLGPPVAPEQDHKEVSRETRRAAAEYLNRPW